MTGNILSSMNRYRIAAIPTSQGTWRACAFAEMDNAYPTLSHMTVGDWQERDSLEEAVSAAITEYERDFLEYPEQTALLGKPPEKIGNVGAGWKVEIDRSDEQHSHIKYAWLLFSEIYDKESLWWIVAIDLIEDKKGFPEPYRSFPEARYEFIVGAIRRSGGKGDEPPSLSLEDAQIEIPPAFLVQFPEVMTDGDLESLIEEAVDKILSAELMPVALYRNLWSRWFKVFVERYTKKRSSNANIMPPKGR